MPRRKAVRASPLLARLALKLITRALGHDMNPVVASASAERTHIVWQGTPDQRSDLYHLESWARTIPEEIATPTPDPDDLPEPTPLPLPDITVVPQDEPVTAGGVVESGLSVIRSVG